MWQSKIYSFSKLASQKAESPHILQSPCFQCPWSQVQTAFSFSLILVNVELIHTKQVESKVSQIAINIDWEEKKIYGVLLHVYLYCEYYFDVTPMSRHLIVFHPSPGRFWEVSPLQVKLFGISQSKTHKLPHGISAS